MLDTINIKINEEYEKLVFPLSDEDYNELKKDIQTYGLDRPIILNEEDYILDGHHRFKICKELGIEPKTEYHEKFHDKLYEKLYVVRCNLKRRHLNTYQKGVLALRINSIWEEIGKKNKQAHFPAKGQQGFKPISDMELNSVPYKKLGHSGADRKVGKSVGIGHDTISRVRYIQKKASEDDRKALERGRKSINEVYKTLQKQEIRSKLLAEKPIIKLSGNADLRMGDFVEESNSIPDNSIDLIFTDPQYGGKDDETYRQLGHLAKRVLKVGGSMIVFIGTYDLPEHTNLILESGLKYWWIICMKQTGQHGQMYQRGIFFNWKPLLWFVNGNERTKGLDSLHDYVESSPPTKDLHKWEQSTVEADHVINKLTLENQVVFDPFMGSGTTGVSALKLKRKFIGTERDPEKFEICKRRINAGTKNDK